MQFRKRTPLVSIMLMLVFAFVIVAAFIWVEGIARVLLLASAIFGLLSLIIVEIARSRTK